MSDQQKEDPYMRLNPIVALTFEVQKNLTKRNDPSFVCQQLALLIAGVRADQIKEDYEFFASRYKKVAEQVDDLFLEMDQAKVNLMKYFRSQQKQINGEVEHEVVAD